MKIVVPLNLAADLVEDLEVDSSGTGLSEESIKLKLNEFDDHALEEALLLKKSSGGEVIAIAIDTEGADKVLFTALAKGADQAVRLTGAPPDLSSRALGRVFAAAATSLGAELVFTGVQSVADLEGQIGPAIAASMEIPCISVVTEVSVNAGVAQVQKEYAGGITATFEVDLPAVIGVQAARQPPRYAPVSKVRQIQQSATIIELAATGPGDGNGVKITALAPPQSGAGAKMLDGAEDILEILKEKGVI
jgi:electron transfer flavoprotein beta subunit